MNEENKKKMYFIMHEPVEFFEKFDALVQHAYKRGKITKHNRRAYVRAFVDHYYKINILDNDKGL